MSKSFIAALAAGLLASPSIGATTTGSATVNILQAIMVTKTADLDFGKVVTGSSAATVRINEDGSRACALPLTCFGLTSPAAFKINGSANETVTISIDVRHITLTAPGNQSMTADVSSSSSSLVLTGGTANFKVAGILNVGANQAAGAYSGTFTVSVHYQ